MATTAIVGNSVIQNEVMGQSYVRATTGSYPNAQTLNGMFSKSTTAISNNNGAGYGNSSVSGVTNLIHAGDLKWVDPREAQVTGWDGLVKGYQLQLTLVPANDPNGSLYSGSVG